MPSAATARIDTRLIQVYSIYNIIIYKENPS